MHRIRCSDDIERADLPPPVRAFVRERWQIVMEQYEKLGAEYDPDDDGEFVVLEPGEETRPIDAVDSPALAEMILEGVVHDAARGCFLAVYIPNNSWALSVVVPDAPGLDPLVRERLLREAAESARATGGTR